jgi:hypothetical protein
VSLVDGAGMYNDPVRGLVMTNGPPPGSNGAGHAVVDSFAAFASLAKLLADPAATLAKMKEIQDREAEADRKLNAVSAAEARLAKKELAAAAKEENLGRPRAESSEGICCPGGRQAAPAG